MLDVVSVKKLKPVGETPSEKPAQLLDSPVTATTPCVARPSVVGKFIYVGTEKFYIKGVTYGAFRPDANKREYHDSTRIEQDFAQIAAHGFNTVRIPHTTPPRSLLDIAHRYGLRVMVGLSAEQYIGYLIDVEKKAPDIEACIREKINIAFTFVRRFGPDAVLPPLVAEHADRVLHWKPQGAEKLAYIVSDLAPKLAALDRYERRALSRRKFAIRALDTARTKTTALGSIP
jgi:hypothetical protein